MSAFVDNNLLWRVTPSDVYQRNALVDRFIGDLGIDPTTQHLECGRYEYGCARIRCLACGHTHIIDANLLLYAKLSSLPEHELAHDWLDDKLNGADRVKLPWDSLLGFVRLSTNTRLFPRPLSMSAAWEQVRSWLRLDTTWCPLPTDDHERVLDELLAPGGITPKLVMDAHLAALAIEHGLALCSADGDFGRFRGLRWDNPIAPR